MSLYPATATFVVIYIEVISGKNTLFIFAIEFFWIYVLKFLKTLLQVQNDNDIFDDRKKSHSHNATTLRERLFFMRFIFPTPDIKPLPR